MGIKEIRRANLELAIRLAGGQLRDLCEATDLNSSYLSTVRNSYQGRGLGDSAAKKIEVGLNLPEGWMDTDQSDNHGSPLIPPDPRSSEYTYVPRTNLSAGMGVVRVEFESEYVVDHLAFKTSWLRRKRLDEGKLALIECDGDSMSPTLESEDLVLVDLRSRRNPEGLCAIAVDGELYVKRVQMGPEKSVLIKSDNPNYDTMEFSREKAAQLLNVIGKVVWIGREF